MGSMKFFEGAIEKKLLDMHCCYIGKVVSTDGDTATVQPLGLMKDVGSTATRTQAVVSDVPIACQKIVSKEIEYTDGGGTARKQTIAVPAALSKGDLVVCLCADRNITEARKGNNALPPAGRHSISDSIIVGIL